MTETNVLTLDPRIELWAPGGTVLASRNHIISARLREACLPQSGTYFLVCRDHNGVGSGDYLLRFFLTPGPPPSKAPPEFLQILTCSSQVVIRWSTNASGFQLQCATRLAEVPSLTPWSDVPGPYGGFGGFHFVTNAPAPFMKFFRLLQR
jgi:hypothetical protein